MDCVVGIAARLLVWWRLVPHKQETQASQTGQQSSHRTHIQLVGQPVNVDGVTIDPAYMPQDRVFCTYARAVEGARC